MNPSREEGKMEPREVGGYYAKKGADEFTPHIFVKPHFPPKSSPCHRSDRSAVGRYGYQTFTITNNMPANSK